MKTPTSRPMRTTTVHHQVNGDGMFQFHYEVDVDRYFWSYQKEQHWAVQNDAHTCNLPGKRAQLRFIGREITLYGLCGPAQGFVAYRVDAQPWQEADLYASETKNGVLFAVRDLEEGAHTLFFEVTGKKNPAASECYISIDYAQIQHNSLSENCDRSQKDIDSAKLEQIEIPSDGGSILDVKYQQGWIAETVCKGAIFGQRHAAPAEGGALVVTFTGNQLEIYGDKRKHRGILRCTVDRQPETVVSLAHCDGFHPMLYRTPFLPYGTHTLHVTVEKEETCVQMAIDTFSLTTSASPIPSFRLDTNTRYQTIEGFGASSGWTIDPVCSSWQEENKSKIADYLYSLEKGIGLTHFRFDLGAGSRKTDKERMGDEFPWRSTDAFLDCLEGEIDPSAQAGQQWMMRAAKERGVSSFTAYVHTPPVWMTKNGHGQCNPDSGSTNLPEGKEADFAAYLVRILKYFSEIGLPFDILSPINEPGWKWEYPGVHEEGCRMNVADMQRVILAVDEALKKSGLPVWMLAPELETVTALERQLPQLYADPAIKQAMGKHVSAHSYFTDMFDTVGCYERMKLRNALEANGSPHYWQTEFCLMGKGRGEGRDYGIMPALWLAQTVHYDMTYLNAVSWQWWLSLSTGDFVWKDGLVYTDWSKAGDEENVIPSQMLWALGQYSRFARPGMVRIDVSNAQVDPQLLISAYLDVKNSRISTVVINLSSFEKKMHVACDQFETAMEAVYLTDDFGNSMAKQKNAWNEETQTLVLPPRSIATAILVPVRK